MNMDRLDRQVDSPEVEFLQEDTNQTNRHYLPTESSCNSNAKQTFPTIGYEQQEISNLMLPSGLVTRTLETQDSVRSLLEKKLNEQTNSNLMSQGMMSQGNCDEISGDHMSRNNIYAADYDGGPSLQTM